MLYKILADIIIFIHFLWILFMIWGFILTFYHFFIKPDDKFFNNLIFRLLHLLGILYVSILALMNKYCPLTLLENFFYTKSNPELVYRGSFIVKYIGKIVYPDINPAILVFFTAFIGLFTLVIFIIKLPEQIKDFFKNR